MAEEESGRWKGIIDNMAGVLLALLVAGFFGLLYEKATQSDDILTRVIELERREGIFKEKVVQEIALDEALKEVPKAQVVEEPRSLDPIMPPDPLIPTKLPPKPATDQNDANATKDR